jgi:hypothetical protein
LKLTRSLLAPPTPSVAFSARTTGTPTAGTGEQIWGLLDVLPDTFDTISEALDTASKKGIVNRIEHAVTVREWMVRMADGQSEETTSL